MKKPANINKHHNIYDNENIKQKPYHTHCTSWVLDPVLQRSLVTWGETKKKSNYNTALEATAPNLQAFAGIVDNIILNCGLRYYEAKTAFFSTSETSNEKFCLP